MRRFEYSTQVFDTDTFFARGHLDHELFYQKLNSYGLEGWELVNVFDMNRGHGATAEVIAVFKRELAG